MLEELLTKQENYSYPWQVTKPKNKKNICLSLVRSTGLNATFYQDIMHPNKVSSVQRTKVDKIFHSNYNATRMQQINLVNK